MSVTLGIAAISAATARALALESGSRIRVLRWAAVIDRAGTESPAPRRCTDAALHARSPGAAVRSWGPPACSAARTEPAPASLTRAMPWGRSSRLGIPPVVRDVYEG